MIRVLVVAVAFSFSIMSFLKASRDKEAVQGIVGFGLMVAGICLMMSILNVPFSMW